MTTREIPFSLDAEESLLGNILLFPQALRECLQEDLQSEDFYLEKNQKIYTVMLNMNERNENIDTISLGSKLKDFGLFDKIGGMEYLMNLAGKTVGASNTKEYIRIIKSKSIARQIIKAGEEISRGAADSTVPIDDIINLAKDRIDDITRHRTDNNFKSSKEVFDDAISKIEKITRAGTTITGIKSCFTDIDNTTAGFQKGDFIILAARPSVGKTAFSLNLAMNAAATCSQAVAFFSLEMPAEQLAKWCYYSMFYGCTALKSAPALPAEKLALFCYNNMFNGCTALTQAPELKASTIKTSCYSYMFDGCSNLSSVTMLAEDVSVEHYLMQWLKNAGTSAQSRTLKLKNSDVYNALKSQSNYLPDNWKSDASGTTIIFEE